MPLVVGIGGTTAASSSSERVLKCLLARCADRGADTQCFAGAALQLPHYTHGVANTPEALDLIDALRQADAIAIASPGYHGTISGFLKNALDYAQELAGDARPYFDGRPIGLIAVAAGWQATGSTMTTLRTIAHALRGWPTPLGITINSANPLFATDGSIADDGIMRQLDTMAAQLLAFSYVGRTEEGLTSMVP